MNDDLHYYILQKVDSRLEQIISNERRYLLYITQPKMYPAIRSSPVQMHIMKHSAETVSIDLKSKLVRH